MSSTTEPTQPQPSKTTNTKSMNYHRQVLQNRLNADQGKPQAYVSPSDDIMSPASQKLNAYKSTHFMKAKPQSLFGRTEGNRSDVTRGDNLFADKENEGRDGAVEGQR